MTHHHELSYNKDISALSYNVWAIFNAKDVDHRIEYMSREKLHHFDILCVQELWQESHYDLILSGLRSRDSRFDGRWGRTNLIGSGMAIFSRFPILSMQVFGYPVRGCTENIHHGEIFAGKGVMVGVVQVSVDQTLMVYNTHMVAQFEKYSNLKSYEEEEYAAIRLCQAAHLANIIQATSRPTDSLMICGDFNASPESPEMQLLIGVMSCCKDSMSPIRAMNPNNKENHTYSLSNIYNSSSTSYFQLLNLMEDMPVQLDHILLRDGKGSHFHLKPFINEVAESLPDSLKSQDSQMKFYGINPDHRVSATTKSEGVVVFTRNDEVSYPKIPSKKTPLSDHWGVAARFTIERSPAEISQQEGLIMTSKVEAITFARDVIQNRANRFRKEMTSYFNMSIGAFCLPCLLLTALYSANMFSNSISFSAIWTGFSVICGGVGVSLFCISKLDKQNNYISMYEVVKMLNRVIKEMYNVNEVNID
eukprot:Tbor_TRINITY_DN6611_c0_g1::TRINITY_DN6611_c0_g1_i1::g.3052::m.3052/K12351/SMPD2; sphingomyelin phosphodiesterase 2